MFSNDNEVIAAARRTGLDVEVIVDLSKLTLKDTVRKMSGVGIIVAAHGAALINTIFMPQVRRLQGSVDTPTHTRPILLRSTPR